MTDAFQDALVVLKRLRGAGHIAYFAGGCVRDLLLGQVAKDYDVATDAPPMRVRELFKNTQAVGAAFGVILVREGKSTIEVATFRTDLEYRDGRRPTGVHFTTAEEDARRRDFTINGLFLDPIENRIIDFVGGQADLQAKQVRAIGKANERFAEDHLRLLRAVRFAARLDFEIVAETAAAIQAHAHELIRISPERIAEEFRKMFTAPSARSAWEKLWSLNLISPIFRFLSTEGNGSVDFSQSLFGKNIYSDFGAALATAMLDYRWQRAGHPDDVRPWLTRAAASTAVRAMRQALKISNEESDQMQGTLIGAGQMLVDPEPGIAAKKRFLATPTASQSRLLLDGFRKVGLYAEHITSLENDLVELSQGEFAPEPLITGDDLTAAGAMPGPKFKAALDAMYDAQLEGKIETKQQAMELAMKWIVTA